MVVQGQQCYGLPGSRPLGSAGDSAGSRPCRSPSRPLLRAIQRALSLLRARQCYGLPGSRPLGSAGIPGGVVAGSSPSLTRRRLRVRAPDGVHASSAPRTCASFARAEAAPGPPAPHSHGRSCAPPSRRLIRTGRASPGPPGASCERAELRPALQFDFASLLVICWRCLHSCKQPG